MQCIETLPQVSIPTLHFSVLGSSLKTAIINGDYTEFERMIMSNREIIDHVTNDHSLFITLTEILLCEDVVHDVFPSEGHLMIFKRLLGHYASKVDISLRKVMFAAHLAAKKNNVLVLNIILDIMDVSSDQFDKWFSLNDFYFLVSFEAIDSIKFLLSHLPANEETNNFIVELLGDLAQLPSKKMFLDLANWSRKPTRLGESRISEIASTLNEIR
jgi:hypothetical protein